MRERCDPCDSWSVLPLGGCQNNKTEKESPCLSCPEKIPEESLPPYGSFFLRAPSVGLARRYCWPACPHRPLRPHVPLYELHLVLRFSSTLNLRCGHMKITEPSTSCNRPHGATMETVSARRRTSDRRRIAVRFAGGPRSASAPRCGRAFLLVTVNCRPLVPSMLHHTKQGD